MINPNFDPSDAVAERQAVAAAWKKWLQATLPRQKCDDSPDDGAFDEDGNGWFDGRHTAFTLARLMATRPWASELECDVPALDAAMRRALKFLERRQHPDGRLDLGGMVSPNEVGFSLPALVEGYRRFERLPDAALADFLADLKGFIQRGADAVLNGEAFTANHRWAAACAPLAAVQSLWPDPRYLAKIEGYLADGIDCDADGCWFEERSPNYNGVANHGVLVMADGLNRPELLEIVKRSLEWTLGFIQPDGKADSSFSHRQDRASFGARPTTYGLARRVAQMTGDGRFTTLAQMVWDAESVATGELMPLLFDLDRFPTSLPAPVPLATRYEKFFSHTQIARIRRDDTALTLAADAGGHFFDTVRDGWGGPKRSDDWFHLQHGGIVIQSLHMVGGGMSNAQPEVLDLQGEGNYQLRGHIDGWTHTLHFRPQRPQIEMPWNWDFSSDIAWREDEINLKLCSDSDESLVAALNIWVRPGIWVEEGAQTQQAVAGQAVAGQAVTLRGGTCLVLRDEKHEVQIEGLPLAKHQMPIVPAPSIPSPMAQSCTRLSLGLRFPVEMNLRLRLKTS